MAVRRILGGVFFFMLSTGMAYGADDSLFVRKNALALKLGYHLYVSSDYTDYWMVNKKDYEGFAGELSYERELVRYLGLELALGFYRSDKQYFYNNLVFSGDNTKMDTTITNTYLSVSLKPHIPLGNHFQIYVGAGPDLYYTQGKFDGTYQRGSSTLSISRSDDKLAVGVHGLAGAEVIVLRNPGGPGVYDWPMSLFLEYKYSYVPVKDFDDGVIKDINSFAGSSVGSHDFNAGGHLIFLGLRWRF